MTEQKFIDAEHNAIHEELCELVERHIDHPKIAVELMGAIAAVLCAIAPNKKALDKAVEITGVAFLLGVEQMWENEHGKERGQS